MNRMQMLELILQFHLKPSLRDVTIHQPLNSRHNPSSNNQRSSNNQYRLYLHLYIIKVKDPPIPPALYPHTLTPISTPTIILFIPHSLVSLIISILPKLTPPCRAYVYLRRFDLRNGPGHHTLQIMRNPFIIFKPASIALTIRKVALYRSAS